MQWLPCGYGHKKLVGGAHTVEGRLFTATYLFTYKHVNHVLTIQTGERPPGHQSFPPPRPSPALSTPGEPVRSGPGFPMRGLRQPRREQAQTRQGACAAASPLRCEARA